MMTNIVCSPMYEVDGRRENRKHNLDNEEIVTTVADKIKIEPIPLDVDLTAEEIFDRFKPVIVEYLGVKDPDDVTPEASMQEDLNADSLDLVELIMASEELFNIKTQDKDFDDIHNIGETCNLILNKRKEARANEVKETEGAST